MSTGEDILVPYTEILRQECPRHVAWIIEESQPIAKSSYQSGAGKSALINAVFGLEGATPASHRTPGVHDFDKPFSFPRNDRIIIHDSQGFEPGEEGNIQTVSDFIHRRSNMPALADQLHEIWICAEIPFAGGRLFEKGVENFCWNIEEINCEDDDEFEAALDTMVTSTVQDLCVKPLYALTPSEPPKWVVTSTTDLRYVDLVNLALELTKIENVWIEMAIAQRSSAQASIDASIHVGRKLRSTRIYLNRDPNQLNRTLAGTHLRHLSRFTMRSVLEVRRKISSMCGTCTIDKHLQKPEFLALLSVLVEDMSDEATNNYPLTEKAVQAIIESLAAIVIAGPTAVVVLFAEWVKGTYKKTKSSVRCLVASIVDLTLTMYTLFYLALSEAPVHASIKAWVDGWGAFRHLDADVVIKKIVGVIADNSVKPEQWGMREEGFDESWMPMETLRGP
ncbi:hypothetical protein C8R45DRAFT_1224809 [Mycena sanguinolenta]|nr:hypothetical protein C8R45DRAFT_1224809 [Mycena sanguinolenta]